jgi:hypothetical protein
LFITGIGKKCLMHLEEWEVTIRDIVDECQHEPDDVSDDRIVMKWRAKLANEPTLLEPFQIDAIMREVRRRLNNLC